MDATKSNIEVPPANVQQSGFGEGRMCAALTATPLIPKPKHPPPLDLLPPACNTAAKTQQKKKVAGHGTKENAA